MEHTFSNKVAILLPTMGRSVRLEWLVDNIRKSTEFSYKYAVYFIAEDDDLDTIKEVERLMSTYSWVHLIRSSHRNINKAINLAFRQTKEEFVYIACDDLEFTNGWLTSAMSSMSKEIMVVGTYDGFTDRKYHIGAGNSGYLIRREYIESQSGCVDQRNVIYNEFYHHFYADTEFYHTARKRGVFIHSEHSVVHHRHYTVSGFWGTKDKTAENNELSGMTIRDKSYYNDRVHLFGAPYEP